MIDTRKLIRLAAFLLLILGITHVLYPLVLVEFDSANAAFYLGATIYGVIYTVLGTGLFFNKRSLLLPALIVNAIGLFFAVVTHTSSIYGVVNLLFIAIDLISVPLLVYLTWMNHRERRN
jgi:hypothetical protein